jgi:hypothetical protein
MNKDSQNCLEDELLVKELIEKKISTKDLLKENVNLLGQVK